MVGFVSGSGVIGRAQARPGVCGSRRGVVVMQTEGGDGKKPFGMFGQMGKIMDAVKKAQEFTKDAKSLQDELAATELEATARDGMVTVKITGNQVPISVEISEELLAEGAEAVSEACTEAFKLAHKTSVEHMQENLGSLASSFGLPANMGGAPGAPSVPPSQ